MLQHDDSGTVTAHSQRISPEARALEDPAKTQMRFEHCLASIPVIGVVYGHLQRGEIPQGVLSCRRAALERGDARLLVYGRTADALHLPYSHGRERCQFLRSQE